VTDDEYDEGETMTESEGNWTVQILAPRAAVPVYELREDAGGVEHHSDPVGSRRGGQVVEASVDTLKANWQETIRKLAEVGDGIDDDASTWGVSQIEVGLTLSATGKLLFIAEASAEASVKITLTRK
jgi:hypothetical protein